MLRLFAGEYGNLHQTDVASFVLLLPTYLLADPRTSKSVRSPTETFMPLAARLLVANRLMSVPLQQAATHVNAPIRLRQPTGTTTSTTTVSPMTMMFLTTPKDPLLPLRLFRKFPTTPVTSN